MHHTEVKFGGRDIFKTEMNFWSKIAENLNNKIWKNRIGEIIDQDVHSEV